MSVQNVGCFLCKICECCSQKSSSLACMHRAVRPMLSFRCSIWPPQKQVASELDAIQRKMIAIACPIPWAPGEDPAQYARRMGRHASAIAREGGTWSQHWFDRALAWDAHVQRNHTGCKWNHSLCSFHDHEWLQEQRAAYAALNPVRMNPWTLLAGRTGTRAQAGKIQPRWQESVRKVRDGTL